jgi:hypothetical protein
LRVLLLVFAGNKTVCISGRADPLFGGRWVRWPCGVGASCATTFPRNDASLSGPFGF